MSDQEPLPRLTAGTCAKRLAWKTGLFVLFTVFVLNPNLKRAILQVEQNAREVLRYADHAHVMAAGQIVMSGPASEIANDQRVLENYIG